MTRRLLYSRADAADMLSMGLTHFSENVAPNLRLVRSGRKVLVPASELERWVEEQKGYGA